MNERKIDYDRGVVIKIHPPTGMDVFMYADEPGIFRNAFGTEIDETIANEAGYDVERLSKEKLKRERLAQAAIAIEQELAIAEKEGQRNIVAEQGGFKVVDVGLGNHYVEDPDGNRLTLHPLPFEQAKILLTKLAPPAKKAKAFGVSSKSVEQKELAHE